MRFRLYSTMIAAALAVVMTSCEKKKPAPKTPTVYVTDAVEQDVIRKWNLVGQIISDPTVDLRARVDGFLEKRNFKQGAFVKKGELLFQIEKNIYKAQVLQAQGSVDIQKAVLKNAQIEYDRKKLLRQKNTISQADLDKATADKDSAIGALEEANGKLEKAKLDLSYTDIKSPIDGRIGLAKYNVGNLVGPESGILATVVSLNPIQVQFTVNEAIFLEAQQESVKRKLPLGKLLKDLKLNLKLSNDTVYQHAGQITFWDNQTDSTTGSVLLRATFVNPDIVLMPGQYVTVIIQSSVAKKSIVIPQIAIQSALGGKFVWVVKADNTVEYRTIKTGYRFGSSIVITKGLKAGEKVITQGVQKVRINSKVIAKKDISTTAEQPEPVEPVLPMQPEQPKKTDAAKTAKPAPAKK